MRKIHKEAGAKSQAAAKTYAHVRGIVDIKDRERYLFHSLSGKYVAFSQW
jgi:hypothetical protein